jgi:hypothetical protein
MHRDATNAMKKLPNFILGHRPPLFASLNLVLVKGRLCQLA